MEGMSTQEMINGQDLSTANVDDLLAAMAAETPAPEPAPAEAPKPKRGRPKKTAPEPAPDLPDLEAMLAETKAEAAASSPAEIAEADALAAAAAVEMPAEEPAPEIALEETVAETTAEEAPVQDTEALMAAMAAAETATDVDKMMAAMAAGNPPMFSTIRRESAAARAGTIAAIAVNNSRMARHDRFDCRKIFQNYFHT